MSWHIPLRCAFALFLLTWYGVTVANEADVRKLVALKFPDLKIESVTKTPYGKLYEVYAGGNIFYTDEKMSFILAGNLIDTHTSINVTRQRLRKLTAINVGLIPLDLAIREVRGNGQRRLIVFSDPLCPFCQRFEQELLKLDNVTIFIMLYPIE
ncbi:MAG TPA: DsbC family protein, partial [Verrucomicrobiae bacterium]|nr:DsbC family protein [Verrucomicrobiae bacterium]